mgnify:CR=1 FL=1
MGFWLPFGRRHWTPVGVTTTMKKKKTKLPTNSLEERNMVRHPMAPPTTSHTDKKKQLNKKGCRKSLDTNDLRG